MQMLLQQLTWFDVVMMVTVMVMVDETNVEAFVKMKL